MPAHRAHTHASACPKHFPEASGQTPHNNYWHTPEASGGACPAHRTRLPQVYPTHTQRDGDLVGGGQLLTLCQSRSGRPKGYRSHGYTRARYASRQASRRRVIHIVAEEPA